MADGATVGSAATVGERSGMSDEEIKKSNEEGAAAYDNDDAVAKIFEGISFDAGAKDFTISAGVKIVNLATRKDGKLADIKEGGILGLTIDKNTNKVTEIDILL